MYGLVSRSFGVGPVRITWTTALLVGAGARLKAKNGQIKMQRATRTHRLPVRDILLIVREPKAFETVRCSYLKLQHYQGWAT